MTRLKQDQGAAFFEWPEPVVIDIICERYQDVADGQARIAIARLQAAALRELVAGHARQAAAARLELIAACAARAIAAERIGRVDVAVLWELTQIASARFRNSPRRKAEVCDVLEAALKQLRPDPAPQPARPQRAMAPARGYRTAAAIG